MAIEQQQLQLEILQQQKIIAANIDGRDLNASEKAKLDLDSAGNSLRSSVSLSEKEEEGRDDLLPKLLAGLTTEKVVQMMTVRKGKVNMPIGCIYFFLNINLINHNFRLCYVELCH